MKTREGFAALIAALILSRWLVVATLIVGTMVATPTLAEQSNEELAMQLSNPVAALISVPIQLNVDSKIGPSRDGTRTLLNIQPVVPFGLNAEWNLISRTILPVVWQDNVFAGAGSQSGFGDVVQSLFLSPKAPTAGGWIWGAGPVFLLPVGSNDLLTADKWGAGPTAVVLKQDGQWTYGALANQIWSFAGNANRADVSAAFVQPFLTYTTHTATSLIVNTESLYDWNDKQWSVPINAGVTQVLRFGNQLLSVGGLVRYWADSPDSGPHGWGFRINLTLLFPR